jgi:hypothetical protein
MQEADKKRANTMRFGLLAIPPVAWGVAFSYLFLVANGFRMDWVTEALIPRLVDTIVVGILCVIVWFAYERVVLKAT